MRGPNLHGNNRERLDRKHVNCDWHHLYNFNLVYACMSSALNTAPSLSIAIIMNLISLLLEESSDMNQAGP